MNILVIAAHGSRKEASNKEVVALTKRIAHKLASRFERVEPVFLQFAEPQLKDTLISMAEMKPEKIVIFSFFIGSGSHITSDIPDLVQQVEEKFPEVEFHVTRHLGKLESIDDVIIFEVSDI